MKQVTWSYPQNGIIKINIDGSYVHETGRAGIGGIIRNSYGDLSMAFSFPVECKKSNLVEAMAVEFGVKWCNQHGYTNFILELDSMNIVNMLTNDIVTNMKLKQGIDSINVIKKMVQMQIKHCFIEGNQVADCLAKLASSSHQMLITQLYSNLPRKAKGLFLLDKWQLPSIQSKYDRANFFKAL
ncbi:hypothetical protein KY285_035814 [Solanum tuberosum]|nr:hypothetical protein KY285_035814 [Solanum tuberosum]